MRKSEAWKSVGSGEKFCYEWWVEYVVRMTGDETGREVGAKSQEAKGLSMDSTCTLWATGITKKMLWQSHDRAALLKWMF